MDNLQNLLNQISIITKKNNEILDATGGRFNMFGTLGVNSYENTHSAIINEFLNPKGSHGFKDQFLKIFIEQLRLDSEESEKLKQIGALIENFKTETAISQTEYVIPGGRIDILIEDSNGHAIVIENKFNAEDQWEQLIRYNKYASDKFKVGNYLILYLTLDGKEATDQSGKDVIYFQISHSKFIIDWLEKCLLITARFPLVRETIIQYINHLKKLTNQDINAMNSEQIVKMLSSSNENILATFNISKNIEPMKEHLINNILNTKLKELATKLGLEYNSKLSSSANAYFEFTNAKWSFFKIQFQFDKSNYQSLYYTLKLIDKNKSPEKFISELSNEFKLKHAGFITEPYGHSLMSKYSNWDENAFIAMVSGEMAAEIENVINRMLYITEKLEM